MEAFHQRAGAEPAQTFSYSFLVDEYSGPVYRFCRSLTYSKEDAEDLFQETFASILTNVKKDCNSDNHYFMGDELQISLASIFGTVSPKSYLFSTALYIWKGWKRKYARRNRIAPVEPLDEAVPNDHSTEESVISKEETRIVRDLVSSLPDKFRIPTIMFYTAELSTQEIAGALKLPAGTVKSRLFKARKLVEKGLRAYE